MLRTTRYVALDLELNTKEEKTTHLIEVGISIGSYQECIIHTQSWYIKPAFDLKGQLISDYTLSDHIIELTGITQDDYNKNAVSSYEVVQEIKELIDKYQPFVNPVVWGCGDTTELITTFKQEGIHFPCFGRRFIDVKTLYLFVEAAKGRSLSGGLRKSMNRCGIKFLGNPHRAGLDAENTLRFYFHLLERQAKLEDIVNLCKGIR